MLTPSAVFGAIALVVLVCVQYATSQRALTTDICAMPQASGPCRAAFQRFYFDPTEGVCSSFTYGGCRGNENNFKTRRECQRACADPRLPGPLGGRCPLALCKCPRGVPITTSIDSRGCEICSCDSSPVSPPKCGPVCMIFCPFGNVLDSQGCPTCTCKRSRCDENRCRNRCPNGRVMDRNDCPTCECKPKPRCPPVCAIFCEFGNVMDRNGCPTCTCKPRPLTRECPLVKCANPCRRGYENDSRGCQTCECKPAECPVFRCRACPNGYEKDSNGCDTCRCKSRSACPRMLCGLYCMAPQYFSAQMMRSCSCNCGGQSQRRG